MNDKQTATAKKGGFIQQPGTANVQAMSGCCGQRISNVSLVSESTASPQPVAASGCCGEPVSSEAGSTGCCGTPAEKQGCCG
jgi:hypothetical protein